MDLLGDLGLQDQLTSVRSENKVLQERVKELAAKVQVLTLEKTQLEAEVEIYRQEMKLPDEGDAVATSLRSRASTTTDAFTKAGNGVFPKDNQMTHTERHGPSNILCCDLNQHQTLLVTGGADRQLVISSVVDPSKRLVVPAEAPVICVAMHPSANLIVMGCMDGSLSLVSFVDPASTAFAQEPEPYVFTQIYQHGKYVRQVVWSPDGLLASCSADGSVRLWKVTKPTALQRQACAETFQSFHHDATVESLCFASTSKLLWYGRDAAYVQSCDIEKDCALTPIPLNAQTDAFSEHVSFCVMDMAVYDGKYVALATDTSRNLVIDLHSHRVVRNLYGHQNDAYSQPKIAWSENGQYLLGNTQEDGSVCIWDVASSEIVERLQGHTRPVRDLCVVSDVLVTTSHDRDTRVWFTPSSD